MDRNMFWILGSIFLLAGAAVVYARGYSPGMGSYGMMGGYSQPGMMARSSGNPAGYSIQQMDEIHDRMIKNLDPETAQRMDAMHDNCMGNYEENES